MPPTWKLGDLVRCKRCAQTFELTLCGRCDHHHPTYVELPKHLVVDHESEFCSQCGTPEEFQVLDYHNHQRAHHGALPN